MLLRILKPKEKLYSMPKYLKALCRIDPNFVGLFTKNKAQNYKHKSSSESKYLFVMRKGNHNKLQSLKTKNTTNMRKFKTK